VSIFTKMNLALYHNLLFTTSKPLLKLLQLQAQGVKLCYLNLNPLSPEP
jgi:hypothetical protein